MTAAVPYAMEERGDETRSQASGWRMAVVGSQRRQVSYRRPLRGLTVSMDGPMGQSLVVGFGLA